MSIKYYIFAGYASLILMLFMGMCHDIYKESYILAHPVIDWNQINVTKELSPKGEVVIIYLRDSIVCYKLLKNE